MKLTGLLSSVPKRSDNVRMADLLQAAQVKVYSIGQAYLRAVPGVVQEIRRGKTGEVHPPLGRTRRTTTLHLRGARTRASLGLVTELVLSDMVRRRMGRSWTFGDRRLACGRVGRGRTRRFGRKVRLFGHGELGIDFGRVDEEPVRVGDAARVRHRVSS